MVACQTTQSPASSLTGRATYQLSAHEMQNGRNGLNSTHPRPESHQSMSASLDRAAQRRTSTASAILSQSSHQTLVSPVDTRLSPYDQHEDPLHPDDEVRTVSRILSRFMDGGNDSSRPVMSKADIPIPVVASFFQTYFAVIHPQYPFLDIEVCADYYTAWKDAPPDAAPVGWPAFFVNMVVTAPCILYPIRTLLIKWHRSWLSDLSLNPNLTIPLILNTRSSNREHKLSR